jgi:hypothetical protein
VLLTPGTTITRRLDDTNNSTSDQHEKYHNHDKYQHYNYDDQ